MDKKFYIKSLHISNFKPFKSQNPPLKMSFTDNDGEKIQFMMLSGFNGYGKTSIFQAVEFVLSGKIEIFEFKDTTRNYTEHVSINELDKESIMVLEIENELSKENFSVIRYNTKVKACKEKECLVEYKDFDLYIINGSFEYDRFKKEVENGDIEKSSSSDLSELLDEVSLDEWLTANYLKQEQSSNILFKNNSSRVSILNQFVNEDSNEYFEKHSSEDMRLDEEIKKIKKVIKNINEKKQKKQVDSLGEKPENYILFNDIDFVWDKLEYADNEGFDTYLSALDSLKKIYENIELYSSKDRVDGINKLLDQHKLISEILIYKFEKAELHLYLEEFKKKKYLMELSVDRKSLLETELNHKYLEVDLITEINKFRENSKVLNKLSSDKEKMYSKLSGLREYILKDSSIITKVFQEICPLCGHNYEDEKVTLEDSIKAHDELFGEIKSLVEENNDALATNIAQEYNVLISRISKSVQEIEIDDVLNSRIKKIFDNQDTYLNYQERLEYLLMLDLDTFKPIEKVDLQQIDEISEKVIKALEQVVEDASIVINNTTFDADEINNIERYRKYFKDLIQYSNDELTIKFDKKEKILKWYLSKQQLDTYSKDKIDYDKKIKTLRELLIRSKKVKNILSKVKDARHKYMTDLISYIEIPLYIYSGKLMQTHQNGLGVFCTTGSSEKVTQFKLTTNGNVAGHDIVNKFSAGQKAVMNIAVILAFRKIRSSALDFFMIDDPCQSMDDINIASLTEILRNEFKETQILISTHEDSTSSYMCYKYHKSGKRYKELNVQEEFYSIN